MDYLRQKISRLYKFDRAEDGSMRNSRPVVFDLSRTYDRKHLSRLFQQNKVRHLKDAYIDQLREYYQVKNPSLVYQQNFEKSFQKYLKDLRGIGPLWQQGCWAWYPWISTLVHILKSRDFFLTRTSRNRNLISAPEQVKFYNAVVGVAGLSIGNSVATSLVLMGGAKYIRLADFDIFSLSNMNRVRAGVDYLGLPKVFMTARQIYLINPYARVDVFSGGITKENIDRFFDGPPKLKIVIDELDSLSIKYLIRKKAQKNRIPVVMGADNGERAVIDIERFDTVRGTPIFNGRLGSKISYKKLSNLSKVDVGKMIVRYLGKRNVPRTMLNSLSEIGQSIVSWPQLGDIALMNGSIVANRVRKIVSERSSREGDRFVIRLDKRI